MSNLAALLNAAMNPLRSKEHRLASWTAYETETWFLAVLSGGLKIRDLHHKFQEPVKALIIQRANHMA